MAEQSKNPRAEYLGVFSHPSVDALATKALALVARKNSKTVAELDLDIANGLRDVAADGDRNDVPEFMAEMLKKGISAEVIATLYIPHAARRMGEDWCNDTLSFARVTIGTARLQSSLRALGPDWSSHGYSQDDGGDGGVIIIIAKDAFHTLGATVLCGQLRRLGHSVRLVMGASSQELRAIVRGTDFDAALISASESESLESLRKCVDDIREFATVCPPIVMGGNVLDQEIDVKAVTGADYTTKDPFEALDYCGIQTIDHANAAHNTRRK